MKVFGDKIQFKKYNQRCVVLTSDVILNACMSILRHCLWQRNRLMSHSNTTTVFAKNDVVRFVIFTKMSPRVFYNGPRITDVVF